MASNTSKLERVAANANALLTQQDVARLLNISVRHLKRLIDAGTVPDADLRLSERIIRWRYSSIRPLIEGDGTRRRA